MKRLFYDGKTERNRTIAPADGTAIYLVSIVINLLLQLVATFVILFLPTATDDETTTISLIVMAVLQVGNFVVVYGALKRKKLTLVYAVSPVKWWVYALSFLCVPLCIIFFVLPANAFVYLLESIGYTFSASLALKTPVNIVLGIIVTVILAPVCEELVFRGALLGGLTKKWGIIPALIVSALCFSLMHMNPEQTVYQFFLGLVAGYLAICSRSVIPSMVLHAGNNLIAVLLGFLPQTGGESSLPSYGVVFAIVTVALLVVGIVVFFFVGKLFAGKTKRYLLEEEKNLSALDNAQIENGERNAPVMGKRTHAIMIAIGLGVCAFMWLIVFLTNMLPVFYAGLAV